MRDHSTYEIPCVCGRLIHSETPTVICQYCGRHIELHWQQQDIPQDEITHAELVARKIRRCVNQIREVEGLTDQPFQLEKRYHLLEDLAFHLDDDLSFLLDSMSFASASHTSGSSTLSAVLSGTRDGSGEAAAKRSAA